MKKRLIYFFMILSVIFMPFDVLAKIKGNLTTGDDVSKGEKLNVSISLEQDAKKEEVNIYQAVIQYDENLFSGVDEESFKTRGGWEILEYNKETHAFILVNNYGSLLGEELISFDLILKDNASPTSTAVKLTNQIVANEVADYALEDISNDVDVNIHLVDLGSSVENKAVYGDPLQDNPVKIYYILTLVVLELMFAIIVVLLYNSLKNKFMNKIYRRGLIVVLAVVELFALSAVFTYNMHRGDLNGDSKLDGEDVTLLAKHLVNSEMMSRFKLESADMNKDGKITPSDLSILFNKTTTKSEYIAKLTNSVIEHNGYEKGTEIELKFYADVTGNEIIEYVILDGKKIKVEKISEEDNEYVVKLEASKVSQKYKYSISEVVLKNGKTVKVDYETEVIVLKDEPKLTAFSTKEDLANSQVKVALTLEDHDNAIVNARYELVNSSGQTVKTGSLDKGKNSLDLKLDNAVSYKFKIKVDYNRGSNSGEYYGTIEDEYDLRIVTNYRLQIGSLALVQNDQNTNYIEKNTNTYLTFTSSNVSGYAPKKVTINNREYSVTSLGNGKYRVSIPNTVLNGSDLKMTKVTLSNGKVILVNGNVKYYVLKNKPTIATVTAEESLESSIFKVQFTTDDPDSTIEKIIARLYDKNNTLVDERVISDGNYNIELKTSMSSAYTLKIFADYRRIDSSDIHYHKEDLLYEKTMDALLRVDLKEFKVDEIYPDKNSIIRFNYNIVSNYDSNVKQVVINNVIYDVAKVGIDNYIVEMNVGGDYGTKNYTTDKIIFENGFEYYVDETVSVDVLKEYPTLDNLVVEEDLKNGHITVAFDLFDIDGSFKSGEVLLKSKDTGEIEDRKNVILGKNRVEFDLENAVKYDIEINVSGKLDSATDEESNNRFEDYNLYKNEYRIVTDYKLEIAAIETSSEGNVTDQFGANSPIDVSFTSSNVTEYIPIKVKVNGISYDLSNEGSRYKFTIGGFANLGNETLKFESITLSNRKEVEISAFKKIEIIKSPPKIKEVTIANMDSGEKKIELFVDDRDKTLLNLKAIVTNELGVELFSGEVANDSFTFNRNENTKYNIKILASYDLNNETDVMEENRYIDKVLFEKSVDELSTGIDYSKIEAITLYKVEEEKPIEKVTDEVLNDIEDFRVKLIFADKSERRFEILDYVIDEKSVTFVLKCDEWVTTAEGKKTNLLKVNFDLVDKPIKE